MRTCLSQFRAGMKAGRNFSPKNESRRFPGLVHYERPHTFEKIESLSTPVLSAKAGSSMPIERRMLK